MIDHEAYKLESPLAPVGGTKYIKGKELYWGVGDGYDQKNDTTWTAAALSKVLGVSNETARKWIVEWNQEKAALINRAMVRTLEISPEVPPIMCRLAKVYQGQVELYLKAVEKDPTDALAMKALNKAISNWERYSGADVLLLARNQLFKEQMAPKPEPVKGEAPVDVQAERQDWIDDD